MAAFLYWQSDCSTLSHFIQSALTESDPWCADYFKIEDPLSGGNPALRFYIDGSQQGCQYQESVYKHRAEVYPNVNGSIGKLSENYKWFLGFRLYVPAAAKAGLDYLLGLGQWYYFNQMKARDSALMMRGYDATRYNMQLRVGANFTYSSYNDIPIAGYGSWVDIVVKYLPSLSGQGQHAVWVNGSQVLNLTGLTNASTNSNDNCHFGIYWTDTIRPYVFQYYLDDYKIVRTLTTDADSVGYTAARPDTSAPPTPPPPTPPPPPPPPPPVIAPEWIDDTWIDAESPITEQLMTRLRDDPISIAAGDLALVANGALQGYPWGIGDLAIGWQLVSYGQFTQSLLLGGLSSIFRRYKLVFQVAHSGTAGNINMQFNDGSTPRGSALTLAAAVGDDQIFGEIDILRYEGGPVSSGISASVQKGLRANSGTAAALTAAHGSGLRYSEASTTLSVDSIAFWATAGNYAGGLVYLFGKKDM